MPSARQSGTHAVPSSITSVPVVVVLPPQIVLALNAVRRLKTKMERKEISPIPWYGSVIVILIGIACWATVVFHQQIGLEEVGRALIYIPLGKLFDMSLRHPPS